jgi:hypothetical protein
MTVHQRTIFMLGTFVISLLFCHSVYCVIVSLLLIVTMINCFLYISMFFFMKFITSYMYVHFTSYIFICLRKSLIIILKLCNSSYYTSLNLKIFISFFSFIQESIPCILIWHEIPQSIFTSTSYRPSLHHMVLKHSDSFSFIINNIGFCIL